MGKVDPNNQAKTIIPKKWMVVTLNWKCYGHLLVAPTNLDANLTLLERCEPLSHTCHESLHQIDEDQNVLQKYP